jgi:hypothetical protein
MAELIFRLTQFRQYLLGTKFLIRTDNAALNHTRRTPKLSGFYKLDI